MHVARLRLLVVMSLALLSAGSSLRSREQPARTALPAADTRIDGVLSAAVARGDVPGLVAVAATRTGILYQGAFGRADVGGHRAMSIDAIFRIASMTKPVTSVAAMQLVEQGRIGLDDAADKFLPELADMKVLGSFDPATGAYTVHRASRPITIRHLFTHTSGFGYGFTSATVRDFKPRRGETYVDGPLLFEPGSDWMYGTSVDWLGRVVEKVSGQNLEDYFREHIFRPLQMVDTFYNVPAAKQERRVTVHRRPDGRADAPLVERPNQPSTPATSFNGGGGLLSTAGDYIRFERMLLNGGSLDGARILSPASVARMGQNQIGALHAHALKSAQPDLSMDFSFIDEGADQWGLGFLLTARQVSGKRSAGSMSWGGINNTYFWIDPSRQVAAVLMMQFVPFADTKALAIYDAFERGVYQRLDGRR
jgi:CubicO group peptidase (beta-lactamase class C family)